MLHPPRTQAPGQRPAAPLARPATGAPATTPPPRHALQGLIDCMVCCCPRLRPAASPQARPEPTPFAIELQDFSQPPPVTPVTRSVQLRTIRLPAGARCYGLLPPGFYERDELLAFMVPGQDGWRRYHEWQKSAAPSGPAMLNMLAMALGDNDFRVLAGLSELDNFLLALRRRPLRPQYEAEDLLDFHNRPHAGRVPIALASGALHPQGWLHFDPDAEKDLVAAVDASPAVGLQFTYLLQGRPVQHWVLLRRAGELLYEVVDPRSRFVDHQSAHSMTGAIASWLHKPGEDSGSPAARQAQRAFRVLYLAPRAHASPSASPAGVSRRSYL